VIVFCRSLVFGGRKNNVKRSCVLLIECLAEKHDVATSQCFYKKKKKKEKGEKKKKGAP
jgi:hypothetical protein